MTFSFVRESIGVDQFHEAISEIYTGGYLALKLRADNDFYSQVTQVFTTIRLDALHLINAVGLSL